MRRSKLRTLMRDCLISMTTPLEPNDPQQTYRAVEKN